MNKLKKNKIKLKNNLKMKKKNQKMMILLLNQNHQMVIVYKLIEVFQLNMINFIKNNFSKMKSSNMMQIIQKMKKLPTSIKK